MSNFTDLDALAAEPGVRVRFTRSVADVERADLLVVPGTKATVEDLARLRAAGLDRAITGRARAGARSSASAAGTSCSASGSPTTSSRGRARSRGSACCRSRRRSSLEGAAPADRLLRLARHRGERLRDPPRPGRTARRHPLLAADDGEPDGCRAGNVLGTSWHGALEHDAFRRALLRRVATARGRRFEPGTGSFAAAREQRLDVLGDLVADHLDTDRLTDLIEGGVPAGLPTIQTEVRPCCAS